MDWNEQKQYKMKRAFYTQDSLGKSRLSKSLSCQRGCLLWKRKANSEGRTRTQGYGESSHMVGSAQSKQHVPSWTSELCRPVIPVCFLLFLFYEWELASHTAVILYLPTIVCGVFSSQVSDWGKLCLRCCVRSCTGTTIPKQPPPHLSQI